MHRGFYTSVLFISQWSPADNNSRAHSIAQDALQFIVPSNMANINFHTTVAYILHVSILFCFHILVAAIKYLLLQHKVKHQYRETVVTLRTLVAACGAFADSLWLSKSTSEMENVLRK